MTAYYNENDPFAAAWLQELIKANLIAQGDVDERSVKEIQPSDLIGYTQCHFFAGIGVWSYALRQAGWPDDRKVWTGSCPCQPFSAAGKKGGFDDTRHLWPDWFRLLRECRPDVVFGEQVASKDGLNWFDLVSTDLEGEGYAVGAADLCAAGVGAPHIRQRLYFAADSEHAERRTEQQKYQNSYGRDGSRGRGLTSALEYAAGEQMGISGRTRQSRRTTSGLAEPNGGDTRSKGLQRSGKHRQRPEDGSLMRSAVKGFWRDCDWIPCIDGKARPVEPGAFPLATGVKNRVGLLRGYGNSLTAPVAQTFIEAYLEVTR
jgi:DNA (cytosine-5)-methyltransferase 1